LAISVSSPIGMNSEVLKINVENVRLITGSHLKKVPLTLSCSFIIRDTCKLPWHNVT